MCIDVQCPICLYAVLKACGLVFKKRLRIFVVVLSLVAVQVGVWYYIWTREHGGTAPATRTLDSQMVLWVANSRVPSTGVAFNDCAIQNLTKSRRPVVEVNVDGNFTERVRNFNIELEQLRCQLRAEDKLRVGGGSTTCRTSMYTAGSLRVVSGTKDNYIDELADDPDILTVVLPWLWRSRSNWSSLTDVSNVPYQRYFDWTADDILCSWIETAGVIKMRYDSMYNYTCSRNISGSALARSLQPLYFNGKPFNRNYYWPNNGTSYPAHFYTDTPLFVFHIHIHRDAVVTSPAGDVITARTKLVLYSCSHDVTPTSPRDANVPCYDEAYVITQFWGANVFHRMIEVVPRLLLALHFLKAHPQIRIIGPEVGDRLAELLEIIGLDRRRLVTGVVRAKIVYQPRATGCGFANVQESQMLSQLYRDYIGRTFPPRPRDRLILIDRSEIRRFTEQKAIEDMLKRAARDYNLTYTLFIDNPTPSLNDTMMMFHSAVIIVAPVGAGESNIFFCQPGTYVVEGVCNLPHVNLCFQRLAHILGHRWHGVTSRGGCETVVDVAVWKVEEAVRNYLRLWTLEKSSS